MPATPIIAARRFGTGLSPCHSSPAGTAALLADLEGPDTAAQRFAHVAPGLAETPIAAARPAVEANDPEMNHARAAGSPLPDPRFFVTAAPGDAADAALLTAAARAESRAEGIGLVPSAPAFCHRGGEPRFRLAEMSRTAFWPMAPVPPPPIRC